MDRSRVTMLAVLLAAPSAFAQQRHHKTPQATPAAKPAAAPSKPVPHEFDTPDQPQEPIGSAHPEGDYGGVDPAHPNAGKSEPHKTKRPPAKGTLAWIGFEAKNGGADVFFQSVAPFEVAQHVENGTLVVELSGLDRMGQQTARPIDAHFFDSPVARIAARRVGAARASKNGPGHGAGIEVRIAFKNSKDAHEATMRSATEADGMYYAYLSFGGGGDAAAPATAQEPEK